MPATRCLTRALALFPKLSHLTPSARTTSKPLLAARRTLSSTAQGLYKQRRLPEDQAPIPSATAKQPEIPAYPYGERQVYKQSNTGLYGEASIRFGNNVSKKHSVKTRRKWRPNVQSKRLYSDSLGVMVRTRVTTRVLRTVDKCGGLDNYLLGPKAQRLKDLGPWGWRLRWRVMQTPAVREMFARQREALGLPPAPPDDGQTVLPNGAVSAEALMAETQGMLDRKEEFDIGGVKGNIGGAAPLDVGFMHEERRPRASEVKGL